MSEGAIVNENDENLLDSWGDTLTLTSLAASMVVNALVTRLSTGRSGPALAHFGWPWPSYLRARPGQGQSRSGSGLTLALAIFRNKFY